MKDFMVSGFKWLRFILLSYIVTSHPLFSSELSMNYNKSLQHGTLCKALDKDRGRLEKIRTKSRQKWSDLQSQKTSLELEKRQLSASIETMVKTQETETNEKLKSTNEKEITRHREQLTKVSLRYRQAEQKLQDAYSVYQRDQVEFQFVDKIYRTLNLYSKDAQTLYHLFMNQERIAHLDDSRFIPLIDAVAGVSRPDLALDVIKTDRRFKNYRKMTSVSRLLAGQIEAWKLVKNTLPDSDLRLEEFIQFNNPSQVQALTFTMDRKMIKPDDLRIIEHISDQTSLDIYKLVYSDISHIPMSFWKIIKSRSTGYWQPTKHILSALELNRSLGKLSFPEGYLFLTDIQNQYALDALSMILPVISEKSVQSGFFSKSRSMSSLQKLFFSVPQISHSGQLKFFTLYLDAIGESDIKNKANLQTIKFLGIPVEMIELIRSDIHWNTLEFAIDSVKKDLRLNPKKAVANIGLDQLTHVSGYQLNALKAYRDVAQLTPDLTSFSYISNEQKLRLFTQHLEKEELLSESALSEITSSFDADLFTILDSGQFRINADLYRKFRQIPWAIRPRVLKYIEQLMLINPKNLKKQIHLLSRVTHHHQITCLEKALDQGWDEAPDQDLLSVVNEYQEQFLLTFMASQSKDTSLEAWRLAKMYLPYIDSEENKYLAGSMLRHHKNPAKGFASINHLDPLIEKASALGVEDSLGLISLEILLGNRPELLEKEADVNVSESDFDMISHPGLKSAVLDHPKQQKIIGLMKNHTILQCPDSECPGLLTEEQVRDGQVCPVCQHSYCFQCRHRKHADLCNNFIGQGMKVRSRLFPGMANFRHGLSNVCYFNSAIKLLAQVAAHSTSFRSFLNPHESPLTPRPDEDDVHYDKRAQLQEALWNLIEQILRGDDERKDFLATYTHKVADRFLDVMRLERSLSFGGIKREQFDAHELLNPLLSLFDYEQSEFRFETLSLIEATAPKMKSSRQETQNFLSVSVEGQSDLQKALDFTWKPNWLKGENQYFYSDLGEYIDALKTIRPVNAPPVLLLQLNRFVYEADKSGKMTSAKLSHEIKVGQTIKIPVYDPKKPEKPAHMAEYKLLSAVHHSGSTDGGHYTSYTLDEDDSASGKCIFSLFGSGSKTQIYCHNDSTVSSCSGFSSGMKEINKGGYLFAYQRIK